MPGAAIKLGTAGAVLATVLVAQDANNGTPSALADTVGFVRVAHLSPDTAPFDFLMTQSGHTTPSVTLKGVAYGEISRYQRLAPGSYTVTLRGTGTGERGTTLLTGKLQVASGKAYTLTATGLRANLSMRVVGDDIQPVRGQARMRVFNAATRLDPAEVDMDRGIVLWQKVGFGTVSSYTNIPPGRHTLQVFGPGDDRPATTLSVNLAGNSVYSLTILDTADGSKLEVRTDAAAPVTPPRGPVETGFGGAARAVAGLRPAAGPVSYADLPAQVDSSIAGALLPALPSVPGPRPSIPGIRPVPTELTIARLGVHAKVGGLRLNAAGALPAPAGTTSVGWYAGGVLPGEPGPAVLAGHVDGPGGPAVFFNLYRLRPGDAIGVRTADGKVLRYKVITVARYPKNAFPAGAVYAATPDSELRLITCGGTFDAARHSYHDNVVVSAIPA